MVGLWRMRRSALSSVNGSQITLPQWQVFHPVGKVFRFTRKGDHFQISDAQSNRNLELMRIDDPRKCYAPFLALCSFTEEVVILSKQDVTKLGRPIQEGIVCQRSCAILLCREHLCTAKTQTVCHCPTHVHIHIQRHAHGSLPIARSRCRIGESPTCARGAATSCM